MNSSKRLAIIIPAYKIEFFRQSIESIANQTCKNFTLYIGDDASPSDFYEIINSYKNKIDIVYKRFENNIGGNNLVAHWSRCIDLMQNEEWIWLFSDDDIMDYNCVELFYKHVQKHSDDNLLHFNIDVINKDNIKIFKTKKFQSHYSTSQFFSKVINREVYSCVIEYIFKKDIFDKVNRFEPFDLAWCSDTATWMKLSLYGGINTIDGATVKWRLSNVNISSMSSDKAIVLRKVNASVGYMKWSQHFFKQNNIVDNTTGIQKIIWLLIGIVYTTALSFKEKYQLIVHTLKSLNLNHLKLITLYFWIYEEFKRSVKSAISYS